MTKEQKNVGLTISVEAANRQYAAALGKTTEQLTDAEKKQAFLNAALSAAGKSRVEKREMDDDRVGLPGAALVIVVAFLAMVALLILSAYELVTRLGA